MSEKKKTLIDKLYVLDRRIIFVFVFFGVLIPFLFEMPLPIKPTKNVRNIYDTIEEIGAKPEGGTVLMSFDFDPASAAEMEPMSLAVTRHIFSYKGKIKLIAMNHWQTGTSLAEKIISQAAKEHGVEYGKDWAFLGYKAGGMALIITLGLDFYEAYKTDTRGNSTKNMEAMNGITKLADLDYMIDWSAGGAGMDYWVVYGQTRYKFKMGGGCTAVMGPDFFPYLQTGQLNGLIAGLVGAAEYEALIKQEGDATVGMKPQSVVHIILILFILFGNVMHYLKQYQDREKEI